MTMTLSEIAKAVQGQLIGADVEIASVSIDTRSLQRGQLYVAIKGPRFDGNEFIGTAEQAGAIAAIVHQGVAVNIPHIVVDDTHLALAELAGAWRRRLPVAVVGVTGSNGKTTVKEMTAAIFAAACTQPDEVLFTQGNLNNDIGVPLTLLRLNEQHRYAVIEMGANHLGEIAYTSRYAAADVAVLNNAGAAHIEGFGSLDGVAKAKGEIIETLKPNGVAVLNRDDVYFEQWRDIAGNRKVLAFGLNGRADVSAADIHTEIRDNAFCTRFTLQTADGFESCALQLAGKHNVMNALAAASAALAFGIELSVIKKGLAAVKPVTGRLQPLVGRLGNIIIDDTYNANAASLKVGLDVLLGCAGEPWVVLGAFGELGSESADIHRDVGYLLKQKGVTRLFAVGADAKHTVQAFGEGATFFGQQEDLIATLQKLLQGGETVLIKGSRSQRMENVAAALVDNFRN